MHIDADFGKSDAACLHRASRGAALRRATRGWIVGVLLAVGAAAPAAGIEEPTHIHVGRPGPDRLGISVEDDAHGQSIHVGHVLAGGAAARAGLQAGDRIVTAGGCRAEGIEDLNAVLAAALPGSSIELGILPAAGSAQGRTHVTDGAGLVLLRLQAGTAPAAEPAGPDWPSQLGLVNVPGGVRMDGSPTASTPELRRGDVLVLIDSEPATDAAKAAARLAARRVGGHVVVIMRDGINLTRVVGATAADHAVRTPDAPCRP